MPVGALCLLLKSIEEPIPSEAVAEESLNKLITVCMLFPDLFLTSKYPANPVVALAINPVPVVAVRSAPPAGELPLMAAAIDASA